MYRDRAYDPFLQAILDNFEDDAPRLVYADWLEGRGDPHGEFIRVQCLLDELADDDPRCPDLRGREQELWLDHGAGWIVDLPPLDEHLSWGEFHRGFPVAHIRITTTEGWGGLGYIPAEMDTFPDQMVDCFDGIASRFEEFVRRLNPASLSVEMSCEDSDGSDCDVLGVLARSPHVEGAVAIDVYGTTVTDSGVQLMTQALSSGTAIRHLNLAGRCDCWPGDAGGDALARSSALAQLRSLNLEGWILTDAGARALASSPYLLRLNRLVVYWDIETMGDEGFKVLRDRFGDALVTAPPFEHHTPRFGHTPTL